MLEAEVMKPQRSALTIEAGGKNIGAFISRNNENRDLGAHFAAIIIRNPQNSIGNYSAPCINSSKLAFLATSLAMAARPAGPPESYQWEP